MQYLFTAIMAIVQGLTEFLPVSSSGHLLLFEGLLKQLGYQPGDPLALSVMLHMGTLVAVAVIFWKDWLHMLRHPVKDGTLLKLFLASLPALFIMLLLGKQIKSLFTGWALAPAFLITALFLALIEWVGRGKRGEQEVTIPRALTMGLFQGVALVPGISRSGSTLLGGVASGLSRRAAAKFSFMMSAPAILGSFLMEFKQAAEEKLLGQLFSPEILLGTVLAAVSGYLAIRYMLKLIERISFFKFALHVALVGLLVLVLQLTGFQGLPGFAAPLP